MYSTFQTHTPFPCARPPNAFNRQEIQPSPLALLAATCSKIGQGFEAPQNILQAPINQLDTHQEFATSWVSEQNGSSHTNDDVYNSNTPNVLQTQNHSNTGLYASINQVEQGQMYYATVTSSPVVLSQQGLVTNTEASVNLAYTPEYDLSKTVDGVWTVKSDSGENNTAIGAQWWQGKPLSWAKSTSSPSHQFVVSPSYSTTVGTSDAGMSIIEQQGQEAAVDNNAQNPAYVQVTRTPQGQIILTQESTEPNKWLSTGTVNVIAAASNAANGNAAIQVQVHPESPQDAQNVSVNVGQGSNRRLRRVACTCPNCREGEGID